MCIARAMLKKAILIPFFSISLKNGVLKILLWPRFLNFFKWITTIVDVPYIMMLVCKIRHSLPKVVAHEPTQSACYSLFSYLMIKHSDFFCSILCFPFLWRVPCLSWWRKIAHTKNIPDTFCFFSFFPMMARATNSLNPGWFLTANESRKAAKRGGRRKDNNAWVVCTTLCGCCVMYYTYFIAYFSAHQSGFRSTISQLSTWKGNCFERKYSISATV